MGGPQLGRLSQERDAPTADSLPPCKDGVPDQAGKRPILGTPGPPADYAAVFGVCLGSSSLTTERVPNGTQHGSAGWGRAPAKSKQTKLQTPGQEVEGWCGATQIRNLLPRGCAGSPVSCVYTSKFAFQPSNGTLSEGVTIPCPTLLMPLSHFCLKAPK